VSPSKKASGSKVGTVKRSKIQAPRKISGKNKRIPKDSAPSINPGAGNKDQPANLPTLRPAANWTTNFLRILAILAVVGITAYIYSIRERVEEFEQFGYAGVFLIALMANATVLLPAPGVAIIYAMGAVFNPLWVGLSAGTGGALGELSGYLAGFSGQAVVEKTGIYNRIQPWVNKYGGWAILVLSAIPNPFFDIAGIAAGIAKMRLRTFLAFTWVGQIIKMTLFAVAGHYSLEWIETLMQ
jgi:uncharacterized membrane protein YdjX (TVP38/TMEM64 family)